MSRGDGIRRDWTHRRLGLGTMKPSDAQLAQTDALLTAVGARQVASPSVAGDPFAAALLDFACDIDLVAGIADLDASLVPTNLLRLTPAAVRPRRGVTWRVLIPAMSGGIAALVVGLTVLLGRGTTTIVSPAATAAAESHQLLRHADTLLADAAKAAPAARTRLVSEAQADLSHVSRLLPLTVPAERPAIRQQLRTLEQQVPPTTARSSDADPDNGSSGQGSSDGQGGSSGTGNGSGTTQTGPRTTGGGGRLPPPQGTGQPTGVTGTGTGTGTGSGTGTGVEGTDPTGTSGITGAPVGTTPSAPPVNPSRPPQGSGPPPGAGGQRQEPPANPLGRYRGSEAPAAASS